MGYPYFKISRFISLRLDDLRHAVGAIENCRPGQICAEHQLEVAGGSREPVLLVPSWNLLLEIDVDGTVGVLRERRTVTNTMAISWIVHHIPNDIGRRERPEGVIRRELPARKVQDVFMPAAQRLPRAIRRGCPVRGLFKHIDDGQGFGAGGPHEDSVAGLAAFANAAPAVDRRCYCPDYHVHDENCR